jgi:hypothetical protein
MVYEDTFPLHQHCESCDNYISDYEGYEICECGYNCCDECCEHNPNDTEDGKRYCPVCVPVPTTHPVVPKDIFLEYVAFQKEGKQNPLMLGILHKDRFTREIMISIMSDYDLLKHMYTYKIK